MGGDHSERAERAAARWDGGYGGVCVCVRRGPCGQPESSRGVQCRSTGTAGGGGGRGFLLPSPAETEASGTCPESSGAAKSPQTSVDTDFFQALGDAAHRCHAKEKVEPWTITDSGATCHVMYLQQSLGPPDLLSCRICVDRRLVEDVMFEEAGAVDAVASEGNA